MAQKSFNGSFHSNNNPEKIGFMANRHDKSKETYKITEYWEAWDIKVRKLKEIMFRQ